MRSFWVAGALQGTLRAVQRIFIGDVQGCVREWERLIARARHLFGDACEIWQVGDLVNKGPENLRSLEIMRREVDAGRGFFVLGNHEVHLLRVLVGIDPLYEGDSLGDVVNSQEAPDWLEWLRKRPLVETFSIGEAPGLMVHAAVHPHWSLAECATHARKIEAVLKSPDSAQWFELLERDSSDTGLVQTLRDDLARLTTCRSVDPDDYEAWGRRPPILPSTAWHAAWRLESHDYGIVFGHWAERGLLVAPGLRGLDSGCVYAHLAPMASETACLTGWIPAAADKATHGGRRPFDCPDDDFLTEVPESPYLSGDEPYSYRPESKRRGVVVRHGGVSGEMGMEEASDVVVVSGLPRSGTSMLMQMLQAGGGALLVDDGRLADLDNPNGYLEWEAVKRIRDDKSWVREAVGHAIKVVAPLVSDLPGGYRYAILFSQRDIEEVVSSQAAMLVRRGRIDEIEADDSLRELLEREVLRTVRWLQQAPDVRALFLDHAELLRDPLEAALLVESFLGMSLDIRAMSRVVDPALYRQRFGGIKV